MAQPAPRISEPLHSRIIWYCILTGAVLWLAVASYLRAVLPAGPAVTPFEWIALGVAVAAFVGSRALARLPLPPDAARARTRMVVQLGLSEVGATFGGVAWLVTGDPWSWAAAAIGLLGIVLVYPGRRRDAEGNASRRMRR